MNKGSRSAPDFAQHVIQLGNRVQIFDILVLFTVLDQSVGDGGFDDPRGATREHFFRYASLWPTVGLQQCFTQRLPINSIGKFAGQSCTEKVVVRQETGLLPNQGQDNERLQVGQPPVLAAELFSIIDVMNRMVEYVIGKVLLV